MSIQILITDDHQLFREGIVNLLAAAPEIKIVGQAGNGLEAIEMSRTLNPDVVIMDLSLPVINGVDATRILHQELPAIRILVLSMHADKHFIKEALEAGASGYLSKNCTYSQLIDAINTVYQGKKYLSAKITEVLIDDYLNKDEDAMGIQQELTERESEILKLIAEGVSARDISTQLFISVKTVGTHKQHILEKLNLKSTVDIIKYAIKKGIISLA